MLALLALLLAQYYPQPLIDRPQVLPPGAVELDLLGNYSNANGLDGEAAAGGLELGIAPGFQVGGYVALPINPDFNFGSAGISMLIELSRDSAVRLDGGFETLKVTTADVHQHYLYGGAGLALRWRLGGNFAVVSGEEGAFRVAHFGNVGSNGQSIYQGGIPNGFQGADLVTVGSYVGDDIDETDLNFNLPIGLQLQLAPQLAITLKTGLHFSLFVVSGASETAAYVPLGIDAVFSPSRAVDVGASFSLPGQVGQSFGTKSGYADLKEAALWLRFRAF